MKKIQFFNPFMISVIVLLGITSCNKIDKETLPANPVSKVSASNASSLNSAGVMNNSGSLETLHSKGLPVPQPVVAPKLGGPPTITNAAVINGNIVTTPSITNQLITATLSGTVNANYLPTTVTFEYGRIATIGIITTGAFNLTLAAVPSIPIIGNVNTNVTTIARPLLTNTTYQFRIKAVNSLGTVYSNPVLFTTVGRRIGESFAGGIVFFIDGTGEHGLIAATVDQGNFQFDAKNVPLNSTGSVIGTGAANTKIIVAAQGNSYIYAANECDQLSLNGFSDWFLPSQAELYLMFSNLKEAGMGNFSTSFYWSSSIHSNGTAVAQAFGTGIQANAIENSNYRVRAVRAF